MVFVKFSVIKVCDIGEYPALVKVADNKWKE